MIKAPQVSVNVIIRIMEIGVNSCWVVIEPKVIQMQHNLTHLTDSATKDIG